MNPIETVLAILGALTVAASISMFSLLVYWSRTQRPILADRKHPAKEWVTFCPDCGTDLGRIDHEPSDRDLGVWVEMMITHANRCPR